MKKKLVRILIIIAAALGVLSAAFFIYVGDYYRASDRESALAGTDSVSVSETDFGYFFDGPGEDAAVIFYPGAKVEDLAYAELLKDIAAGGADCFLVHMPFNLAFFGINKAGDVIGAYDYERWFLAGHSLGGAMAAEYSAKNGEKLDGLIFLAAYSAADISELDLKTLSIYGSEDKVVSTEKLEAGRELVPSGYEELVIEGGNHALFGNYGEQRGDGEAKISAEEQREITAEKILELINNERNNS